MSQAYKTEGQAVRQATREKLAAMRAARKARRPGNRAAASSPEPTAPPPEPSIAPQSTIEELGLQASEVADALAAQARAHHDDHLSPAANTANAPDAPNAAPSPSNVKTNLINLPGIGAGLVYLLQCNGVDSLETLAQRDIQKLREDLGFVGSLVNLETWIAYAQGHIRT